MLRCLAQQGRMLKKPLFTAILLTLVLVSISGCTTAGRSASGVGLGSEIITASDETDIHRRARIRLELASSYFESGQTQVALDEVKQALVTNPSYADAYNLRGLIYMRLDDFAQAEESFRRALGGRTAEPGILHNYAWLLCQQARYAEADQEFAKVMASPRYNFRSRTLMAQGICQKRAGQKETAEMTLLKAYELDAGNPIVAYNLSSLLLERGEFNKAQFYIRRLNNSELANAESLWLGIKVERALSDVVSERQLASQLSKRFPDSRENAWYERGVFNE